jgi:hypothetical protein
VLAGILGAIGFAAVIIHIDIGGDYPDAWPGPGLTLDEPFNVGQGVYLDRPAISVNNPSSADQRIQRLALVYKKSRGYLRRHHPWSRGAESPANDLIEWSLAGTNCSDVGYPPMIVVI